MMAKLTHLIFFWMRFCFMYTVRHIGRKMHGIHINWFPYTSLCYMILKLVDDAKKMDFCLRTQLILKGTWSTYSSLADRWRSLYTFFQQDSATAYTVVAFMSTQTVSFGTKILPCFPGVSSCDFYLHGTIKQCIYISNVHTRTPQEWQGSVYCRERIQKSGKHLQLIFWSG